MALGEVRTKVLYKVSLSNSFCVRFLRFVISLIIACTKVLPPILRIEAKIVVQINVPSFLYI